LALHGRISRIFHPTWLNYAAFSCPVFLVGPLTCVGGWILSCVVFGGSCGDVCGESDGKEGDALRANTVGNWGESMTSRDVSSAKPSGRFWDSSWSNLPLTSGTRSPGIGCRTL